MLIVVIPAVAIIAAYLMTRKSEVEMTEDSSPKPKTLVRAYGLKDIEPLAQKGGYKTEFDFWFDHFADKHDVPFALLKAHALMESSLKETAFRDENPSKRKDREGWASRGLMQILWANDLKNDLVPSGKKLYDRFKKYGFPGEKLGTGEIMFKPEVNIDIAAQLIKDNLKSVGGNLRDAVNMYNAGVKESVRKAPHDYVNRVLNYYNKILGEV